MKNNENDFIDIPTELEIENLETYQEIETLSIPNNEVETLISSNDVSENLSSKTEPNDSKKSESSPQSEPKIQSIDGNPDVLDIEVKNLEPEKKSNFKKGVKIVFLIILLLLIVGIAVFAYYKFLLDNKPVETKKELNLQISSLDKIESFEEAYNRKLADFQNKSEGEGTLYEVSDGTIKYSDGDTYIVLRIEDAKISKVSYLKEYNNTDIIGIKDTLNNYYFAHIPNNLKDDMSLNYENSKLIKIDSDKTITNIALANYLNSEEVFYLAIKNEQNYFIGVDGKAITTISPVYLNVYNGINIDIDNLNIDKNVKNKLKINGVGLYYDGALYIYKGSIEDIVELEIKYNGESFDCEKIFVAYNKELEFFDLYVITFDEYLYKINLLDVDIDTKKVNIKKYESKISEYTIFDDNNIGNSVDVIFENGETVKLK